MATSDTAFNYDDLLDEAGGGWRSRLIALAVVGLIVAVVAVGVWWQFFRGGGTAAVAVQTAKADRGNVQKTVSTTGTVAAQQASSLTFQQSGKVQKVNVILGQAVKQGDVLAEVDPSDLQTALDSANMSLTTAQSKLDTMLQGSTASALASADQSVTQAQANVDKAGRAMQALQDPPTATDLASAQQAVTSAQAQVGQAEQSRAKIDTASDDAVTAANAGVDKAQKALDQAEATASTAVDTVSSSQSSLYAAESTYCGTSPSPSPSFCPGADAAPISSGDQTNLVNASDPIAASKVLSANTAYVKAVADKQSADDAVDTARNNLSDAEDALSKAEDGPTSADIASADAAVSAAQVSLATAQSKLADLQDGPTQDQFAAAQSDIDSAAAGLTSAQAKRDETYQGSLATDIQQQRQAVTQARNAVATAVKNLDKAKLIAPFDGTVAALNVQVGDTAGTSTGSSSSAPIILNTPDQTRIDLTISETDVPNVKAGQSGYATFDAIAGSQFPIIIDSIGTNPTTTQGVVTYAARAHFDRSGVSLGGGGSASPPSSTTSAGTGQSSPPSADTTPRTRPTSAAGDSSNPPAAGAGASATPAVSGTPGAVSGLGRRGAGAAGVVSNARPTPGMNAKITIITASSQNVVRIANAAVQRDTTGSFVEVKKDDGTTEKVTVQVGLADSTNTEITSGLDEGATVIIPTRTASAATTSTTAVAGGGFGGGVPPGGVPPGGGPPG